METIIRSTLHGRCPVISERVSFSIHRSAPPPRPAEVVQESCSGLALCACLPAQAMQGCLLRRDW